MKWCFYSPGFLAYEVLRGDTRSTGGAEAQIAKIAAMLAAQGHDVDLIYGAGGTAPRIERHRGVQCRSAIPGWFAPGSFWRLWKALSTRPDVIYARLPDDFLWILGLYARLRGAIFIYSLANDRHCNAWTAFSYRRWFHAPLFAAGIRSAHVIALQHEDQRRLLPETLRAKAIIIPNLLQWPHAFVRDYDQTKYDVAWIAKIRPVKRLSICLDLAATLDNFRFALVGGFDEEFDAAARFELENRMAALANVTYMGPLGAQEVMSVISQSKVLINTSAAEGFPNAMLEAWSAGVPVVSLAIDPGGVIERERIGLVSRTLEKFSEHVSLLVKERKRNSELGARGLAYVKEHHSIGAVREALERAGGAGARSKYWTESSANRMD